MNEEALFERALAASEGDRAALLDRECAGQPELRQRIEALLQAHAASGGPLDQPAPVSAQDTNAFLEGTHSISVGDETPGTIVAGKYKLLQQIGEGGMGSVWMAEQREPVKRMVAVKLIKDGSSGNRVLARFEAERQAIALMDHPNIARLYDAGSHSPIPGAPGLPYFVMELVKGVPLTEYCDQHKLPVTERLKLFQQICSAVQHAHQKGIIHRDLKPSNILIESHDSRPVPKVIDFGLAKATTTISLTERSLFTAFGTVMGTPLYMAPEQATFNAIDVDTRADIYALGVILYELLTGTTPIEKARMKKAALDEMLRVIREEEPPTPSSRLSTTATAPTVAAFRGIEPRQLGKLLKGDLDWIIMKALAKERDHRYDTANALAADVGRFLVDEPVLAGPPSARYRFKKFVKRNKGRVVAATVVLAALLIGICGTTIGFVRADEQRRVAEQARADEAKQRKVADEQRVIAQGEALRATTAEGIALAAAQSEKTAKETAIKAREQALRAQDVTAEQRRLALDTVRDVLLRVDDLMKNDAKLAPLRIEIIRRMIEDVDRIRDHAIKNPLEDRTEAIAYSRIGEIYYRANRIKDSAEWYGKAYAILKKLADSNPKDGNYLRNLAVVSHSLADSEWRLGNGNRARELHADGLRLRKLRLALLGAKAEEIDRVSAEFDIAESYNHIAYADLRLGEPQKAIDNYTAADTAFAALQPPMGNTLKVRRLRSEIQVRIADARSKLGELDIANKHYQAALADRESLLRLMPRPANIANHIKTDIGQSRMYIGDFLLMMRKNATAAHIEYLKCLRIFEEVLKDEPDNLDLRQRIAAAHYRLGVTACDRPAVSAVTGYGPDMALRTLHFKECLQLREALAVIDSRDTQTQVEVLLIRARVGQYEEAERTARRLLDQAPADRQTLFQVACGLAICSNGSDTIASRCREQAFQVLNTLIEKGWKDRGALESDPDFDPIVRDRRFADLLKRLEKQ